MVLAAGGVFSGFGLLVSYLCTTSRALSSMAVMGIFPKSINCWLGRLSARGSPTNAIIFMSTMTLGFSLLLNFSELIAVSSFFYAARLLLVLIALPTLRFRYPELPRPYKMPLGPTGLVVAVAFPILFCIANVVACSLHSTKTLLLGPGVTAAVVLLSAAYVRRYRPQGFQGRIERTNGSLLDSDHTDEEEGGEGEWKLHRQESAEGLEASVTAVGKPEVVLPPIGT